MEREHALAVAKRAAREVGAILRGGRHADKHASTKGHRHDPVTIFDRHAEKIIVSAIESAFPEHGILSEEGTRKGGTSPYRWVIDLSMGRTTSSGAIPSSPSLSPCCTRVSPILLVSTTRCVRRSLRQCAGKGRS